MPLATTSTLAAAAARASPDAAERELLVRLPADPPRTSRPPLLFVHGEHHGAWCWDEHWLPGAAARGWRAYALSLRGHGRSRGDRRGRRWRLGDFVEDVHGAVARLPEPPVLVGHGMGGLVVQRVLESTPLPAAVLVAPVPPYGGFRVPLRILRRHPTDLARVALLRSLPRRRDYFLSERLDDVRAEQHLDRMQRESPIAQLEAVLPRRREPVAAPVLVLGGEEDALIAPVEVVRTARCHGTRARLFRGMGHDLMLDAGWRAPLEVMLHWLGDALD